MTAEALNAIYEGLLRDYYGDVIDEDPLARHTWARIPHFFGSPYYVYQYATCFASTARLMQDIRSASTAVAADGVERYLSLLRAGGSDYPDAAAGAGGRRSGPAGHGAGGRHGAGRAGRPARAGIGGRLS